MNCKGHSKSDGRADREAHAAVEVYSAPLFKRAQFRHHALQLSHCGGLPLRSLLWVLASARFKLSVQDLASSTVGIQLRVCKTPLKEIIELLRIPH